MLPQLVDSALWLSIPLLFLGLSRTKWWIPLGIFLLLFVIGLSQGSLIFSDLWMLPSYTKLWDNGVLVFLWVLVGLLWAEAFPLKKIYSARVTAFLIGLCLGKIALPFLVLKSVADKRQRGLALFAGISGSILLPYGDLGHFCFGVQQEYWYMLLVISALSFLASGTADIEWKEEDNGQNIPYVLGLLITVSLWLAPEQQIMILGAVALGLSFVNKAFLKINYSLLGVVGFAFFAIVMTTAGGVPELLAWALEDTQFTYATYLNPTLFFFSALLSAILGEWNMVLVGQALQERALDIQKEELWTMMALGAAIGGISPFILAEAWRANWKRILSLSFLLLIVLGVLV